MKKHNQSHVRYTPKLKCNLPLQIDIATLEVYEEEGSKVVGMVNKSQIVVKFHAFNRRISASSFWWRRKLNKY